MFTVDFLTQTTAPTSVSLDNIIEDVKTASRLISNNLVRYCQARKDEKGFIIFSELCAGGSLSSVCGEMADENNEMAPLSESSAASYILQVCSALSALHSSRYWFGGAGGISIENVLLGRGNILKLANYYPGMGGREVVPEEEVRRRQEKVGMTMSNAALSYLSYSSLRSSCAPRCRT